MTNRSSATYSLIAILFLLPCIATAQVPTTGPATKPACTVIPVLDRPEVVATRYKTNDVFVTWKEVPYADGYFVIRVSGTTATAFGPSSRDANGYLDKNPPQDSVYYVKGFVEVLFAADPSAQIQPKPATVEPPQPPGALPLHSATRHRGYPADWIDVSWQLAPGATGYKVRCQLSELNTFDEKITGTSEKISFTGIPPVQGAKIQIVPFNSGGEGPATAWFDPIRQQ